MAFRLRTAVLEDCCHDYTVRRENRKLRRCVPDVHEATRRRVGEELRAEYAFSQMVSVPFFRAALCVHRTHLTV